MSTTASLEDLPVASYCNLLKDATRDQTGPSRHRSFSVERSLWQAVAFLLRDRSDGAISSRTCRALVIARVNIMDPEFATPREWKTHETAD